MNTYKKMTQAEKNTKFIDKANSVWGYKYDYSRIEYINSSTPITIGFGDVYYQQTPNKHLLGKKIELYSRMLTTPEFIEKSILIWGDRFDYTQCIYRGVNQRVILVDTYKNKTIEQIAKSHLSGIEVYKYTSDDFFKSANLVHDYKYDYSGSVFDSLNSNITIKCLEHGDFTLKASSHLYSGSKCPGCHKIDPETIINLFLGRQRFDFHRQHRFTTCTNGGFELPFDFFIPSKNLCIEFHSKSHRDGIGSTLSDDQVKLEYCENKYINLLVFNESDKNYINIIESYLR